MILCAGFTTIFFEGYFTKHTKYKYDYIYSGNCIKDDKDIVVRNNKKNINLKSTNNFGILNDYYYLIVLIIYTREGNSK